MLQLTAADIALKKQAASKQQAIRQIAQDLVARGMVAEGYAEGMLTREAQNSTYLGSGIAIPHGTLDTRELVRQTGVQVQHFAEGVDWGNGNIAYLVIGIAAKSDEHLGILKQLTTVLSAADVEQQLQKATQIEDIISLLSGANQPEAGLLFDSSVVAMQLPVDSITGLVAVAAAKLAEAKALDKQGVASLITEAPTHLGQGLWLVSTASTVSKTALAFTTPASPFSHQGEEVKALLVVAAASDDYLGVLTNLVELLASDKIAELNQLSADELVNRLSEVRQQGVTRVFTIKNPHGLHARPGATLVNVVKQFEAKIMVSNLNGDGKQANAKSLMKVIALGVKQGHQLEFVAQGSDAEQALAAIETAIANGLGEGL